MARTASSAEPDRLAAYGTAAGGVDEALARDLARLEPDAAAFFTGAGELAPAGTADQWTSPLASLRAEVAHLGRWVAGVGAGFLVAGADGDGDGTYEATDDALAPRVGRAVRSEHRVFLAEQLSTLYERARTGELDPTSGQLAHILAMARLLVDDAADPQSEAERLVAAMGVGDLITAVALLSSGAADATSVDHPAVAGMLDLGHILSLGLESDPVRADRWADEILGHAVFGSLPGPLAEGLAVTGAGNAPGTSVYGVEVFGTLVAGAGPTPALGLVHRLYGTTDPVAPIMATAASRSPDGSHPQAPLAHAITRDALDDPSAMVRVFGGEGPPAHDEVRRDVLVAAVDPSLPDDQRVRLANDLAGHYVAARESPVVTTFDLRLHSPTVTEGFGAAMQPLLDHWQGDRAHRIAVDAGDGGASIVDDTLLWDAVGHLGQDPGGANGLSTALAGTTTARLTASYATAAERTLAGMPTDIPPFGRYDLQQLGHVYAQVATTVGNARFSAVVDAVESDGDRLDAAVASLARGVVGEVPGGSTLAGATEALAILTRDDPDVTGGGSTMSGLAVHLTRDLVAFNLQARPDLATPGLNAALRDAKAADGDMGVHLLIHDDRAPLDTSGGRELADLQQLVHDQEATVNLDLARAIDDTMRTEGG